MNGYPLIFKFNEVIFFKKFKIKEYIAMVNSIGQALLVKEDDKYWIYGVQPGGMAESGRTVKEALHNFKIAFRNVLSDIEEDSNSFQNFRSQVDAFFNDIDKEELSRWEEARKEIKAGKISISEDISVLKKETNEFNNFLKITLLAESIRIKPYSNDAITAKIDKENSNSQSEFLAAA